MQTLTLLLLLLLGTTQASQALGPTPDHRPEITITDAAGQQVQLRVPVRRLVTTNGLVAEIICALGGAEAIVGLSDYTLKHDTRLLKELQDKANIGSAMQPSYEKIIDLQPELVIAFHRWMAPPDLEAKLRPLGIAVVRMNCYQLKTLPDEIACLGRILGKEWEAALYQEYFRQHVAMTTSRIQGVQPVRAYVEGFADYGTSSSQAPDHESFALAGLSNIAASLPVPFPKVSAEWVVAANPAVIIKSVSAGRGGMGFGFIDTAAVQQFYLKFLHRPAWDQIEAVKNNRVYLLASEINSGPRMPLGLLYKAKWCHPERFQDVDPEELHRQWLRRWHNRELQGIYVYPKGTMSRVKCHEGSEGSGPLEN